MYIYIYILIHTVVLMKKKNVSWNVSLIQTQTQEPLETYPFFILNRVSSKTLFFPSVMIE